MTASQAILALNAFDERNAGSLDPATAALVAKRKQTLGPASMLFYDRPLHVVSAEGVWIETADGTRYLDVYNNVPSVGHCNPRVVAAIAAQFAKLNIHTRYLYDNVHSYAERLLATFPAPLDKILFTCTGSESNDLAMRLTTTATGKRGFIVTESAYHGNTAAVTDVSPSSRPGQPLAPHVRAIAAPLGGGNITDQFVADLRSAISSLEKTEYGFAGLLVDTIFSSDGVAANPPGFLAPAVDATHAAGGLFIADEVQPGFGRTGAAMWGFQRHGVTPDIVTMGKPMGNGFPIGGVVASLPLMQDFADSVGYFNTFGGNPVASAAGLAVLDEIEQNGLVANAEDVGGYLLQCLKDLMKRRDQIKEIRGAGLYLGIEIFSDGEPSRQLASCIVNAMRDRCILIGTAGRFGNVLKIRPPLIFSRGNADLLIEAFDAVLKGH